MVLASATGTAHQQAGDLRSAEGAAVNGNGAAYPEARRGQFDWQSDVNAEV
jgi:hypothetical protein